MFSVWFFISPMAPIFPVMHGKRGENSFYLCLNYSSVSGKRPGSCSTDSARPSDKHFSLDVSHEKQP